MGTVLIHAGMPKTGSTSIQTWLRLNAAYLRDAHDISVLRALTALDGPSQFEPYTSGPSVNTVSFLLLYHSRRQQSADEAELTALADNFADGLDRSASELGTVLLTAEGFASFFIAGDGPLLRSLERVAQRHTVRIAYYVRPQHTTLEARWRQWGFRTGLSPSAWVLDQAHQLRYADTVDRVRAIAPGISFEARPFRPDLLVGGDVVVDFAKGFLGIDDPPGADDLNENLGIALDFANLLRGAPRALLDDPGVRIQTGARQLALGMLGRSWDIPESAEAQESRAVLHRYAYDEFEPRNRVLIAERGWATESFIPPPDDARPADEGLGALDRLWRPEASDRALSYLYAALSDLMKQRSRR